MPHLKRLSYFTAGATVLLTLALFAGAWRLFNDLFPLAPEPPMLTADDITGYTLSTSSGEALPLSRETLDQLLTLLSQGESTRIQSLNETPAAQPYYLLTLTTRDRAYMFYFYTEKGTRCLESPYEGVWRLPADPMPLLTG